MCSSFHEKNWIFSHLGHSQPGQPASGAPERPEACEAADQAGSHLADTGVGVPRHAWHQNAARPNLPRLRRRRFELFRADAHVFRISLHRRRSIGLFWHWFPKLLCAFCWIGRFSSATCCDKTASKHCDPATRWPCWPRCATSCSAAETSFARSRPTWTWPPSWKRTAGFSSANGRGAP